MQMVDVHLPATDGRRFIMPRYTQPDRDQELLLAHLRFKLPEQPPPGIAANPVCTGKSGKGSAAPTF